MVFGNGVKNIKAAAYNGARTVVTFTLQKKANNKDFWEIACSYELNDIISLEMKQTQKMDMKYLKM